MTYIIPGPNNELITQSLVVPHDHQSLSNSVTASYALMAATASISTVVVTTSSLVSVTSAGLYFTFSIPQVQKGAIVTFSYAQPGNGVQATDDGADLESFSLMAVFNDSTYTTGPDMSNGSKMRLIP
jgi:hypothetical protein